MCSHLCGGASSQSEGHFRRHRQHVLPQIPGFQLRQPYNDSLTIDEAKVGKNQLASVDIGCLLKWWYPQNTPKWSFLVGKPMVVGTTILGNPHILIYNISIPGPMDVCFIPFCSMTSCHQPFQQLPTKDCRSGDWDPFLVEQNTKKRYETTWVQGVNESWRKWFCCRYLSELQGRHIYVLWGASTRKLSKYYEIWVGRLNPSVINIICYHLVLVWNEELLEWGTYEGSNKHLCRLLPHEFDSKIFEILTLLPQTCFFVK